MILRDILRSRAASSPQAIAYVFLSQYLKTQFIWTYETLHQRAQTIQARLHDECRKGDRVLLSFAPGPEFIAAFFACQYAGLIAVPIPFVKRDTDMARMLAVAHDTGACMGLTTADLLSRRTSKQAGESIPPVKWVAADSPEISMVHHSMDAVAVRPEEIAYLQYTSGSTSEPRGVMITHSNVVSNLQAIDEDFQHTNESVGVTWLPYYHDMGLVYGYLQPLYNGYPCYVLSPASFVQRPVCWLEAISQHHGTHSGGPNFAYDLCVRRTTPAEREKLDLNCWKIAFNGAEPVRQETMERFHEAFKGCGFRRASFYPSYGLAEATLKVTGRVIGETPSGELSIADKKPVSCGSPPAGTEIRIVDPDTRQELPEGESGEIWVRSSSVAAGYWNKPEQTRESFQARLIDGSGRTSDKCFLRTGDLGVVEGGGLRISGRLKDVVIIRGQCHHPEDIEWTIRSANSQGSDRPGAAFAVVVEGEERLVVLQETGPHLPVAVEDVVESFRRAVAIRHALQIYAVAFTVHIPKTSSGKVKRHACQKMYLENSPLITYVDVLQADLFNNDATSYTGPDEVEPVAIEDFVSRHAALALNSSLSLKHASKTLAGLGLDSLGALELCHAIQHAYGIELPFLQVMESTTSAIATTIKQALSQPQPPTRSEPVAGRNLADEGTLAVSPEQERLWVMQEAYPASTAYNLFASLRIRGSFDADRFCAILLEFEAAQPYLRATFQYNNGVLTLRENKAAKTPPRVLNLRGIGDEAERRARQHIRDEIARPFDLSCGLLHRFLLMQIADQEWLFASVFHHIVSDLWSLRVFLQEVFELYTGRHGGSSAVKATYADFIATCKSSLQTPRVEEHLAYWQKELNGAPSFLEFGGDTPRQHPRKYEAGEEVIRLESDQFEKIRNFAQTEGTTPFVVLLTAYALLLHRLSNVEDLVIVTPYANRDKAQFRDVFGLFAQPMPVRTDLKRNPEFRKFLQRVKTSVSRAIGHYPVPFSELVARVHPERRPGFMPIAQVFFGYNPELIRQREIGDLKLEPIFFNSSHIDFDLWLDVTEERGQLGATLRYASDMFTSSKALAILNLYAEIVATCLEDAGTRLADFASIPGIPARETPARDTKVISIASTFVAEPVVEFLKFWAREFDWTCETEFAPLGQVFQALLGGADGWGLRPNHTRVLLLRIEDWSNGGAGITEAADEFVRLLRRETGRSSIPYVVCVCPRSPRVGSNAAVSRQITEAEDLLRKELGSAPQIRLLWGAEIASLYCVERVDDEFSDSAAGIPYTAEWYAALATMIFRTISASHRTPLKAIACDCDNTLWKGVAAEDGIDGLRLTGVNRELSAILRSQLGKGVLLCLCSKNEETDVIKAFKNLRGLGIGWDDFAAKRINWEQKSENLRSLSEELQIAVQSFLFIDDDPVECAEVGANYPEVLTLHLPKDNGATFLRHYWAFDSPDVTTEGERRTELYREKHRRKEYMRSFTSLNEFIASLDLVFETAPLGPEHVQRVRELMYRTTQFNTTGMKLSASELRASIESGRLDGRIFKVRDKFGDYGLVGVAVYSIQDEELVVESLLLSCRALGRGVEYHIAAECGAVAAGRKLAWVVFPFWRSTRNQPALQFLERAIGNQEITSRGQQYRISATSAMVLKPDYPELVRSGGISPAGSPEIRPEFSQNPAALPKRFAWIAANLTTARSIVEATRKTCGGPAATPSGKLPETVMEQAVARIWKELLGREVTDVNSDFFDIGGDSLKGVQVLSRIQTEFGVALPIAALFEEGTTVAGMGAALNAALLEKERKANGAQPGITFNKRTATV